MSKSTQNPSNPPQNPSNPPQNQSSSGNNQGQSEPIFRDDQQGPRIIQLAPPRPPVERDWTTKVRPNRISPDAIKKDQTGDKSRDNVR